MDHRIDGLYIKRREGVFFFSYIIFLIFSLLSTSLYFQYFKGVYNSIIFFCCILLMLQEVINLRIKKRELKALAICVVLFVIAFLSSTKSAHYSIAAMILFIFCSRNIEFEKIGSITITISKCILLFVVISSYLGIIENYQRVRAGDHLRQYLGFRYALNPPTIWMNILALTVYLRHGKVKLYNIVLYGVITLYFYFATDSRLTAALSLLLLVILYLTNKNPLFFHKFKFLHHFTVVSFPLFFVISFYLTAVYDSSVPWMRELNEFLGKRLAYGHSSLIQYGITLFGRRDIDWVGNGLDAFGNKSTEVYSFVDSFYIQVIQHYGIVFSIVLTIAIVITMSRIRKKKEILLAVILCVIFFHCIIDNLQLYLMYNTFWFIMGSFLISNRYKRD